MFHHASHLTFGAMLMAMSSFGQTYFVSLYGQDFREAFGLTDGGLGGLYAIGTVMSAITLTWDFDTPVIPSDCTSLSIRLVETPRR